MKYFEDIRIGDIDAIGNHVFTTEAIKSFAMRFDPQPFHTDEEAARRSHFGALCASGWHTVSQWMRCMVDHRRLADEAQRARGEPVAKNGPSPGVRDIKWLKPVYAGDTITFASEVIDTRELPHRPGWGLVVVRNTGTNQHGDLVLSFTGSEFIERLPQG
jgi:acyl dehydratase